MNTHEFFPESNGPQDPLPPPNVKVRKSGDTGPWTEGQVRGIIANPLYAGIGPYPSLVTDEQWVRAAAKAVREDGSEQFFVNLLAVLRDGLKDAPP